MPPRCLVLALALVACKDVPPSTAPRTSAPAVVAPPPAPTTTRPRRAVRPDRTRGGGEQGKLVGVTAAHNRVRAEVGVGALVWSDELGRWAADWANRLAAKGCNLVHRPPGSDHYGENIYWSSNASTAADVVAHWAAERADYDHRRNRCAGVCGHFTQVVWKRSTTLGCGVASCPGGGEIWVCNYDPPGNVMGQSPY